MAQGPAGRDRAETRQALASVIRTALLGYVVLEQAQAAVDMVGHRLVPVWYIDLK